MYKRDVPDFLHVVDMRVYLLKVKEENLEKQNYVWR